MRSGSTSRNWGDPSDLSSRCIPYDADHTGPCQPNIGIFATMMTQVHRSVRGPWIWCDHSRAVIRSFAA